MRLALITGLAGEAMSSDEAKFLAETQPCGLILFSRNCREPSQISSLVNDVKAAIGDDELLVLIDQEGGRVQRLRPPLGRALPPAMAYANLYDTDPIGACRAAFEAARLVARDLLALGINTNCAPVLDVPVAGAHDVIGDRAYGDRADKIIVLARAVADGYLAGGMLPVMKHIPGHGRAGADSHLELPTVTALRKELSETDFAPFKALADLPAAMSAHVVFSDIDPDFAASTSSIVTREVIRGEIGFNGLLMSDDISMKALTGSIQHRAEQVIAAGSDIVLHCNGDLAEMRAAAAGTPKLAAYAEQRYLKAIEVFTRREDFDVSVAEAALASVLAGHRSATESV